MPQSLANFHAAMKDVYEPGLREAVNNSNPVFTEAQRNDEDIVGRQAVWSVHIRRSTSTGARAELAALPTAGQQAYIQPRDDLKFLYHTIKVSGPAKQLTRSDAGAFTRALESELRGAEKDLKNDVARQVLGQHVSIASALRSGTLGRITAVSSNTLTLNVTRSEMRYFFIGELVEVINGSTAASRGASAITAINPATRQVTVASAPGGTTTNDYLVRQGNLNAEINGLRFLINKTQAYAGIDPASNPEWASLVVGDSSTAISELIFEQAQEAVETDGDGSTPNLFICEHSQRRKLASTLQVQKRYEGREMTLTAGWKGLQVAQGVLVADRFVPETVVFGITTSELVRFVGLDFTWDDDDGKVLYKALDGSDAVEARFKAYLNMEVTNRNSHVRIDLAESGV